MPHLRRPEYDDVTEFLPKFAEMTKEAGRDPASVPVTVWGVDDNADRLKRFRDLGIDRVSVSLPSEDEDTLLPVLDKWAALIRKLEG